jgi:phosphoribosylamine--glycine ligase
MNILLLGSGGREHAIAKKISESTHTDHLFILPGNAGTAHVGENINIPSSFDSIKEFVLANNVRMIVVGPEQPLVDGIWNYFHNDPSLKDIIVVGPSKNGAQLEGSKDFAKQFMLRHSIPTAGYKTFFKDTIEEGKQFLATLNPPYVLKADGLAGGKGVIILSDLESAKKELDSMLLEAEFGQASSRVVIEEFLSGIECSVFVLTDGKNYKILPCAKDYKRIGEKDTGLNTGGMGSVSPVPFADKAFINKVEEQIIKPTIQGIKEEGLMYQGFIFLGLMNVKGNPYVIEYNVRMGDPETESVFPRIKSDIVDCFLAFKDQSLDKVSLEIDPRVCTSVMLCAEGYPVKYEKGKEISGLQETQDCIVFHAGTKLQEGKTLTNGGRVLTVTCLAETMAQTLEKCYANVEKISFSGKYYRRDIGQDLLNLK